MPNWVRNIVKISGKEEDVKRLQELVKGTTAFDFERIIPMPCSLKIESGSLSDDSYAAYMYISTGAKNKRFTSLKSLYKPESTAMTDIEFVNYLVGKKKADLQLGEKVAENLKKYGYSDWYLWSIAKWGTKWNACDVCMPDAATYQFDTAWAAPVPILERLSKLFPNVEISHKWADEDIGSNTGDMLYNAAGNYTYYPESCSPDAYELYAYCWGESDCLEIDNTGHYQHKDCDKCGLCC